MSCLGGGATSSGSAQLGLRPRRGEEKKKKQLPKEKWLCDQSGSPDERWEPVYGCWGSVSYILEQGGRRGFSFDPSPLTPPQRNIPLPFVYASGGWRGERGRSGAPGVHAETHPPPSLPES